MRPETLPALHQALGILKLERFIDQPFLYQGRKVYGWRLTVAGQTFDITAGQLIRPNEFRRTVFDVTGRVLPTQVHNEWAEVVKLLVDNGTTGEVE